MRVLKNKKNALEIVGAIPKRSLIRMCKMHSKLVNCILSHPEHESNKDTLFFYVRPEKYWQKGKVKMQFFTTNVPCLPFGAGGNYYGNN